jgi:hypothetical protein
MISSASYDSVSRLVADRSMCLATALDKAFENIDCMIAILCCQAKNRFYESTQRLIQPRRVLCIPTKQAAVTATLIVFLIIVTPCNRDSPDGSRSDVNVRAFPAFLQGRSEVRTTTVTLGRTNDGRGVDLIIFAGIWTHSPL